MDSSGQKADSFLWLLKGVSGKFSPWSCKFLMPGLVLSKSFQSAVEGNAANAGSGLLEAVINEQI